MVKNISLPSALGDKMSLVLTAFFNTTLGIADVDEIDLVLELKNLSCRPFFKAEPEQVLDIYRRLDALRIGLSESSHKAIR
jgi:hypothetical protein